MPLDTLNTLQKIVNAGIKLTPMMEQFYEIKKNYPNDILFFRMGDFYEVFFDDAQVSSKILNITLTHRGKVGNDSIPMAGIPHHAAATYIDRITVKGYRVAICEQVQDPKDAVGIVKRAVTQVVSPGLPYDLDKTEANEQKFICSGEIYQDKYILIAIDFTTGEFAGHVLGSAGEFLDQLRLYSPQEFISYMGQWDSFKELNNLLEHTGVLKTLLSKEYFSKKYTEIYIEKLIPGYKRDKIIKLNSEILNSVGALAYYISSTQHQESFFHIKPFRVISDINKMKVTLPTLTGLEIFPRNRENYKESLLGFLDKCQTAMGSRKLRNLFLAPITDIKQLEQRHDLVEYFSNNAETTEEIRKILNEVRDLDRILAKVSTGRATSSDLLNISKSFSAYQEVLKTLDNKSLQFFNKLASKEVTALKSLSSEINKTINDEIGATLDKGNLIKDGCNKKRDQLSKLSLNANDGLVQLEQRYRNETGIQKLRVKSNNIAGYFIEVSKLHSNSLPEHFNRKQTLVNAERFVTKELLSFEKDVLAAKGRLEKLEREIFKNIIESVSKTADEIIKLAEIIGHIDAFQSLAWIAIQEDFKRPVMSDQDKIVEIKGAFHPLIKSIIKDQFISHDLCLNQDTHFGLITGPNMAGKTTVMREVAIIQLLAQIGSFVPAKSATLGTVDYLFSRLGASDDILKGQSTFMVEMAETAEILRHATSKSLIILDEVGRGTSTYDGLSIAWALVEHFAHKLKAITLFATHYHELIDLVKELPQAKNLTVETMNNNGEVQFLYRLIEEGASQSFGIYVAKLAGLPTSILKRSQELLNNLESDHVDINISTNNQEGQLSFFDDEPLPNIPEHLRHLENSLETLDIMRMTPLEAIHKLDELQRVAIGQKIQ